ncbi:beta-galactosidase [Cryptosporangium aurantiacum]|uniref:Beta-galactosidase n=1 Tax=Cryptosporangium aurantiacum TaxID=134849 RepID=A0A1M7JZA7_9ACTN|nr:beta-galactosidase [Cryptosporangium aurantiacum]SHM57867.1 beta-galactosidase [Cryptosporangium aurantiacum]
MSNAGLRAVTARLGGKLAYGGDYNPEQWPESVWLEDVALMKEAKVNLVSVGIFSWAKLEPAEKEYEFGWLDRVLDLLHDNGIAVDLANASATPPPWFSRRYPDSLPVDANGQRRWYGARQAFCPSSPDYRTASARLTRAIGERYAEHPAVAMWHVHNEYGCHNWHCYCDTSAEAFRTWLRDRYSSLDTLNEAWGTAFWSQRYYDWAEIIPPRTPAYHTFANPTQQLDFWRFSSDELLDCFRAEAEILREVSSAPVTTNFMTFFKPLDYWAWAAEQDLISNDHYRIVEGLGAGGATHDLAMSGDLIRSLAGGQPWLLMEHSTSAVNWQPRNPAKLPGQLRRDSLTHTARGADGALFFQWRQSKAGAEKFHSALVPHAGTDSKLWRDVVALGNDLHNLEEVAGSTVRAEVAITVDWESWWAIELDSHPSVEVTGLGELRRFHRALWERGVACDFVHPDHDLSGYRLVIVPTLYLTGGEAGPNLTEFVEAGGTALVTYFSGIVDHNDHVRLGGYPGAFRDLLGVRVEEFNPLLAGDSVELEGIGSEATGTLWTEAATATTAEVLVTYKNGPLAGRPVITSNSVGNGEAWYVGTRLDAASHAWLVGSVLISAGVKPVLPLSPWPDGLDVVERVGGDARYLFAINHSDAAIAVPVRGKDLLTGREWAETDTVGAGAVVVIRLAG